MIDKVVFSISSSCDEKILYLEKDSNLGPYTLRAISKDEKHKISEKALTNINEIAKLLQAPTAEIQAGRKDLAFVAKRINYAKDKHNNSWIRVFLTTILPRFILDILPFECLKTYQGVDFSHVATKRASVSLAQKTERLPLIKRLSIAAMEHEILAILNKKFDSKIIEKKSLLPVPKPDDEMSCFAAKSAQGANSLFEQIAGKSLQQKKIIENAPFKHSVELLQLLLKSNAAELIPAEKEFLNGQLNALQNFGLVEGNTSENSWENLKAFLTKNLSEEVSNKVILAAQLSTMEDFYQKGIWKEDSEDGEKARILLKEACRQELRMTLNLIKGEKEKLSDYETLITCSYATTLNILEFVENKENEILETHLNLEKSLKPHSLDNDAKITAKEAKKLKGYTPKPALPVPTTKTQLLFFSEEELQDTTKLSLHLDTLTKFLKKSADSRSKMHMIDDFVSKLPFPLATKAGADFWLQVSEPQTVNSRLASLMEIYQAASSSSPPVPQSHNTAWSLLAMVHHLSILQEDALGLNTISLAPIYFIGHALDKTPFNVLLNKADTERRQLISDYFYNSQKQSKFPPGAAYFNPLSPLNISIANPTNAIKSNPDLFAYDKVLTAVPALKAEILSHLQPGKTISKNSLMTWSEVPEAIRPHLFLHLSMDGEAEQVLQKHGLSHLIHLKKTTLLASMVLPHTKKSFDESKPFTIKNSASSIQVFSNFASNPNVNPLSETSSLFLYTSSSVLFTQNWKEGGENLTFKEFNQKIQKMDGIREAILQKYGTKAGQKAFLPPAVIKELATTHAQPEIQPHHVINYFSDQIPQLYHRETQASFEGLFFKTPVLEEKDGHHTYMQPVADALKDPGFIKQCESFIRQGVDHYLVHSKSMANYNRIRGASFFVRLGCHLQRLRPESKELQALLNSLKKITDSFVDDPSIALQDKVLLHYDRIYRSLGTPVEKLTKEEIKTILGSWFFVQAYSNQYVLPYVKHDAETFTLQLIEHLMAHPEKQLASSELVHSIVQHLPSYNQLPENEEWDASQYPHLTNKGYSINLATGRVVGPTIKNKELLSYTPLTSTALYKHLFEIQLANAQTHTFYKNQTNECNFFDSIYSSMVATMIPKGQVNQWDSGIEFNQKFRASPVGAWELFRVVEGRRERFVLPNTVEKVLPGSLIAGYHHWVAEEGDPKGRKVVVTDPTTGKEVAYLDQAGFIHLFDKEGKSTTTLLSNLHKEEGKEIFFSKFEREKFIQFEYEEGAEPALKKITFDRYTTVHDKANLQFIAHADGTLRWKGNEQFALATPGSAVQLTSFTNFLQLVHNKNPLKQKVLVPIQEFDAETTKSLSTVGELDVKDSVLSKKQNWEKKPISQWLEPHSGNYHYVEFDLVKGKLKPKSQEGKLFLAYLQVQQKDYRAAAKLLRSINTYEDLSETGQNILKSILNSPETLKDACYDNKAIVMIACHVLQRYYQRTPKEKHLIELEIGEDELQAYQMITSKIDSALCLTKAEFEVLEDAVPGKAPSVSKVATQVEKQIPLALKPVKTFQAKIGNLYEKNFSATTPLKEQGELADFDPQIDGLLGKGEMIYSAALKKQFKDFKEEYKEGEIQLEESLFHVLKSDTPQAALGDLREELSEKHLTVSKLEAGLSMKLLKLVNKSKNKADQLVKGLKAHGGVESQAGMENLLYLFIQKDPSLYKETNSSLTDEEIEELYQLTAEFLQIRIQRQQIERSRDLTDQALAIGATMKGKANKEKEFELIIDQIGAELCKKTLYDITEYPLLALFEAMRNINLRGIQVELLKKIFTKDANGKYPPIALQLIMGGGKTSVLAALLIAESCVEGRIPLFLTPRMQFETVKPSLGESLKDLSIELIPLDYKREDLNIDILTYIHNTLLRTKEHEPKSRRQALMMTPDALQTLELELHSLFFSEEGETCAIADSPEIAKKITLLQEILKELRTSCDAIGDEVHLLEDENKEVNFPVGDKVHVSPERIDLVKNIFGLFSSQEKNIEVDGKQHSFDQLLDLTNKTRTEVPSTLYHDVIAPKLAALLAERYQALALDKNPQHRNAFVRYTTGAMDSKVEGYLDGKISKEALSKQELEEDLPFLEYTRKTLFKSEKPELQEAAQLIALTKHLITQVLPFALNNFSGQNFGRTFDAKAPGKVIPYLAVGTPATTEFGYHWETCIYQLMEGLCGGCVMPQVLHFADTLKTAGQFDAKVRNIAFSDTEFYKYFKMLTGRDLGDLENPVNKPGDTSPYDMKVVEEIMDTISKNPSVRLEIEAFTAGEHLHYFPSRLMSTSQSLYRQVDTFRASSGTPTNNLAYPISLQEGLILDKGTEGRIVHNMRLKAMNKSMMHTTNTQDPELVLDGILKGHKEKDRVYGFQDFIGMFKGKDNLEIASGFMRALQKNGNPQKAVAFFYKPPGYPTPDFMTVVTAEHPDEPIILEGTKPSDFEKLNLKPEDYFIYYDERHTQGTDVKQPPTAINIQTKGDGDLSGDLQAAMRLRQYLNPNSQDVEYLIHENAKAIFEPIFGKFPPTVDELLTWEIRNLAIGKARGCLKAYKAMLDDIPYQMGTEKVLNCNVKNEAEVSSVQRVFGPFIKRSQGDDPFAQFGPIDQEVTTVEHLAAYSDRIKTRFLSLMKGLPEDLALKLKTSFDEASEQVLEHAAKNEFLQSTVSQPYNATSDANGFGMQVQQQVQVQQEQQVKVTVQQEQEQFIEQEYNMMNKVKGPMDPRPQDDWTPEIANDFLKSLRANGSAEKTYSGIGKENQVTQLREIMADSKIFKYQQPYFKAIPETVFATKNFLTPYKNTALPVFHNLHRMFAQVLNVQADDGSYCQVLISAFEAKQWKKMIEDGSVENVWLTQPNLNSLANAKLPLKENKEIIRGMLPVALLAGDIAFLSKHMELAKSWFNEKAPSEKNLDSTELYKLKRRLAHLAVHNKTAQQLILQNSPLFGTSNLTKVMEQLNIGVLNKQINMAADLGAQEILVS